MKLKNFVIVGFLMLVMSTLASCSNQEKEQNLTVLAWNVWHAGHLNKFGADACESTIDIIKKSQADVVLMVETYGSAPMIADSLGYGYHS